jgi:hypothetical protein
MNYPECRDRHYFLDYLCDRIEKSKIDFIPVLDWDNGVKSRLIESMIYRQSISDFYFDCRDNDNWKVIDGVKRLSVINSFFKNEFSLSNLDYLHRIEGLNFSKLERNYQKIIEEYPISCFLFEKGVSDTVILNTVRNINLK